jgi:hypothetical protein
LNQTTFNQTAFTTTALPSAVAVPATKKKRGWLPLLTVLFLISYGLMTMLIVEQGQTIESQRVLIRELFRDSTELSALKRTQSQTAADPQNSAPSPAAKSPAVQAPSVHTPSTQTPSAQTPSTQAQTKQAPSSQAVPQQHQVQKQNQKQDFQMPSRPASDLADEGRSLISI